MLHRAGIAFQLVEARDRLGGRILSVDGFDLGPAWFWPEMQPEFAAFVQGLGVRVFPQAEAGDVMVQRGPGPAQRYPGMRQEPAAMRLAGGMAALVDAISQELPADRIHLNARATGLTLGPEGVGVTLADGSEMTAAHLMLAVPPRLLAAQMGFTPPLPPSVTRLWQETPTWMAPHAKFIAAYDRPFWRGAGLSGAARSQTGPLVEIHDASGVDGKAALFGFVGVPAAARVQVGKAALTAAALRQLGQTFGPAAARPLATYYKDWAADPLTTLPGDPDPGSHPSPVFRPWIEGEWSDRMTLIGSETSHTEPGYLAGAFDAAMRGTAALLAQLARQRR